MPQAKQDKQRRYYFLRDLVPRARWFYVETHSGRHPAASLANYEMRHGREPFVTELKYIDTRPGSTGGWTIPKLRLTLSCGCILEAYRLDNTPIFQFPKLYIQKICMEVTL